jgi:secondary thiamine-phosphate synthase enzyme
MQQHVVTVSTKGRGLIDITAQVNALLANVDVGPCNVFVQHTSASLVIQENADPAVRRDLLTFFNKLADHGPYEHDDEGPDDMPAHVKSALTKTSEVIPIKQGKLALGTWQALYLFEHRDAPHTRRIIITVIH